MTPRPAPIRPVVIAAGLCLLGLAASAQTAKAPKTQLWIDLSTGSMAGMPEMDLPMGGGLGGGPFSCWRGEPLGRARGR